MKNYNMILIERLPGKTDKYECLTGEEIVPSNQQQVIEQTKFSYSPLGKDFEKANKSNRRSRKKNKLML